MHIGSILYLILMLRGVISVSSLCTRTKSTKTLYENRIPFEGPDFNGPPAGMVPRFIYLVARHGERFPTEQRMKDINRLAAVFRESVIPQFRRWSSPFTGSFGSIAAGELTARGTDEMLGLGQRIRSYFPTLLGEDYFPNRYNIVTSQVARTAASAVAFSQTCFGKASEPQAVALTMAAMHDDKLLRFFDVCPKYACFKESVEEVLDEFQDKHYDELVSRMRERLQLPDNVQLTRDHILGLWTLCISVVPETEGQAVDACSLFSSQEHDLMEWIDDTKLLNKCGWAGLISLQMASPLLQDIYDALGPGRVEQPERRARMLFGHAESLCPLICQLGLFGSPVLDGDNDSQHEVADAAAVLNGKQHEVAPAQQLEAVADGLPNLVFPPKPPWWGATVAPYAANIFFAVYEPEGNISDGSDSEYKVQIIFNEQVVMDGVMSGSDKDGLLPLSTFMALLKGRIEDFNVVCAVDDERAHLSSICRRVAAE